MSAGCWEQVMLRAGFWVLRSSALIALFGALLALVHLAWRAGDRLSYHYHVWALVRQVRRRRKEVR